MSRAELETNTRRRLTAGLAPVGIGLALLLAGCGAGQIAQTDTQSPAVNGASGTIGPIAVRDAQLAFPDGVALFYQKGSDAKVIATIANSGGSDDQLISVSSPAAQGTTVDGDRTVAANHSVSSGSDLDDDTGVPTVSADQSTTSATSTSMPTVTASVPTGTSAPSSASSSAPGAPVSSESSSAAQTSASVALPLGQIMITLDKLRVQVYPGQTIPVTFVFAKAGSVTINLPIGAPPSD